MRRVNIIDCNTPLPDGTTVGSRINALAADLNGRAQAPAPLPTSYGPIWPLGQRADPLSVARDVYRGTNFRGMFGNRSGRGPVAQAAAGAYAAKYHKDRPGPFGMDTSAINQWRAGWAAQCKK